MPWISDDVCTLKSAAVEWWGSVEDECDRLRLGMPVGLTAKEFSKLEGQTGFLSGQVSTKLFTDPVALADILQAIRNRERAGLDDLQTRCLLLMQGLLSYAEGQTVKSDTQAGSGSVGFQGLTSAKIVELTGASEKTVQRRTREAGVKSAGKGGRNRIYNPAECLKIAHAMANNGDEVSRTGGKKLLAYLKNPSEMDR